MAPFDIEEDELSEHEGTGNSPDEETTMEQTDSLPDILNMAKTMLSEMRPVGKKLRMSKSRMTLCAC